MCSRVLCECFPSVNILKAFVYLKLCCSYTVTFNLIFQYIKIYIHFLFEGIMCASCSYGFYKQYVSLLALKSQDATWRRRDLF